MLPQQHKLTSSAQFRLTMREGARSGGSTVVVHRLDISDTLQSSGEQALSGGPRFGLVVSKAVGNAVIRHRVSRRLRHVLAGLVDTLDPATYVVVRALPPAADSSSAELEREIRRGLDKTVSGKSAKRRGKGRRTTASERSGA